MTTEQPSLTDQLASLDDAALRSTVLAARRKKLHALWNAQVERFAVARYDPQIAWFLAHQKLELFDRVTELEMPADAIPFLTVVPFAWCACYTQLAQLSGKKLAKMPFPDNLQDIVKTPTGPYHAVDVRWGEKIGAVGWRNAAESLKREGRRPLTLAETLALLRYCPALIEDGLLCASTRSRAGDLDHQLKAEVFVQRTGEGFEVLEMESAFEPKGARLPSCRDTSAWPSLWCDATDE